MLCLSNVGSLGGSKLPSDIGLLSADMTAFPPLAPVKSGLSSHQGAQPVEPTFQHCCCCRSRAMARLSTVCTMAMVCYVLTLAVALSLRTVAVLPQPRAIRPDPSWGRWRVSNWWEILSSCASCSCRVVVCQHFWPPRTYINQASIHLTASLAEEKKKDNSRSTAQHRHTAPQSKTEHGRAQPIIMIIIIKQGCRAPTARLQSAVGGCCMRVLLISAGPI